MKKFLVGFLILILILCTGCVLSGKPDGQKKSINLKIGWLEMGLNSLVIKSNINLNYNNILMCANDYMQGSCQLYLEATDETGTPITLNSENISWSCPDVSERLSNQDENHIDYTAHNPGDHVVTATYEGQSTSLNIHVYPLITLIYMFNAIDNIGIDLDSGNITSNTLEKDFEILDRYQIHAIYGMTNKKQPANGLYGYQAYTLPANLEYTVSELPLGFIGQIYLVRSKTNNIYKLLINGTEYRPGGDGSFRVHFIYDKIGEVTPTPTVEPTVTPESIPEDVPTPTLE